MKTPRNEIEAVIEALLFASSEPLPRAKLFELFDEEDRTDAEEGLATVLARFPAEEGRGILAEEVAGGVRLVTRPELAGWLRRFFEIRSSGKLSMAALETLAIVAYRQPITAPEIQQLRGVQVAGVLKTLLERRLVKIAGRKAVVGNPFLYRTTREFLIHFGLRRIDDLPPLEEVEETFGEAAGLMAAVERASESVQAGSAAPVEPTTAEDGEGDREESLLRLAAEIDERESEEHGEVAEIDEDVAETTFAYETEPG